MHKPNRKVKEDEEKDQEMIVEFFGLSNSGKSVLKKRIGQSGEQTLRFEDFSAGKKFSLFLKYFFAHPISTKLTFIKLNCNKIDFSGSFIDRFKIWKMRNSYLAAVFAKAAYLSKVDEKIFVDEYICQSLFMIFNKNVKEKEVESILNRLPRSDYVVIFRGDKKRRDFLYNLKHPNKPGKLLPGSFINEQFGKKWLEVMEHNFPIIERVLRKRYSKTNNGLPGLRKESKRMISSMGRKKDLKGVKLREPEVFVLDDRLV
tara:strand:- start:592 stop:1368 length:777 start_codon:yes stop_codon:yes gene_type:complete